MKFQVNFLIYFLRYLYLYSLCYLLSFYLSKHSIWTISPLSRLPLHLLLLLLQPLSLLYAFIPVTTLLSTTPFTFSPLYYPLHLLSSLLPLHPLSSLLPLLIGLCAYIPPACFSFSFLSPLLPTHLTTTCLQNTIIKMSTNSITFTSNHFLMPFFQLTYLSSLNTYLSYHIPHFCPIYICYHYRMLTLPRDCLHISSNAVSALILINTKSISVSFSPTLNVTFLFPLS